jgi:hydroxyacylglutathione hydrolase
MLNVAFFTFNPFQENTYMIANEKKQCWIVDPGMYDDQEVKAIKDYITRNQLQPQGIINTHAHIDHILGVQELIDTYNIPFGIHADDLPILQRAEATAAMFGFEFKNAPKQTHFISEKDTLKLGDDNLKVFLVPGHSPGSIAFYYPAGKWVISGDVLFNGSIGRTDLPGGDYDTLINSIRTHLFPLPDDTQVLSGHGPATTIGDEKADNPFLR